MSIDQITQHTNKPWTISDSCDTYGINDWGGGYFSIGKNGSIRVSLKESLVSSIDLYEEIHKVRRSRDISFPLLVRFPGILQDRVHKLNEAFNASISKFNYLGDYTPIYPIKVNQKRNVITSIINTPDVSVGLEAGSKPELLAVLAVAPLGSTIVCNGYKDREFIRLALIGQRLGHKLFLVIEKEYEAKLIIEEATLLEITPRIGLRIRLSSLPSSKWADTCGDNSKFGLSGIQILKVTDAFFSAGLATSIQLIHFHMGSQITELADYEVGLKEAMRYYTELIKLNFPIKYLDIGGGLGIDYDGTKSCNISSINHNLIQYSDMLIGRIKALCTKNSLPNPNIFSESGRALTAHHALLVIEVIAMEKLPELNFLLKNKNEKPLPLIIRKLKSLKDQEIINTDSYWKATQYMQDISIKYNDGKISLNEKVLAECFYTSFCDRLRSCLKISEASDRNVLEKINTKFLEKYICNFSVFKSLPDTWAIGQLLPVIPLHRLSEEPLSHAVLHDLTCDSDGKIKQYVNAKKIENSLPVHLLKTGKEYLLGVFLVGAYQEILGNMHNLFGNTDSISMHQDISGEIHCSDIESRSSVKEMLGDMGFSEEMLTKLYHQKVNSGKFGQEESQFYFDELCEGLKKSSYLSL